MLIKKGSEIAKEFMEQIVIDNDGYDMEAVNVALLFFQLAWNAEVVGHVINFAPFEQTLKDIEQSHGNLWSEFVSPNKELMVNQLRSYKRKHYADDTRVIVLAGINERGNIQISFKYD